jgi:hypothetical protein
VLGLQCTILEHESRPLRLSIRIKTEFWAALASSSPRGCSIQHPPDSSLASDYLSSRYRRVIILSSARSDSGVSCDHVMMFANSNDRQHGAVPARHRRKDDSSAQRVGISANISAKRNRVQVCKPRRIDAPKSPAVHVTTCDVDPSPAEVADRPSLHHLSSQHPSHNTLTTVLNSTDKTNAPSIHGRRPLAMQRTSSDKNRQENSGSAREHSSHFSPFSPNSDSSLSNDSGSPPVMEASSRSSTASPSHGMYLLNTALGAGRLDPFQVYCKRDLPLYVHRILDHFLNFVCTTFTLADKPHELDVVRAYVMGWAMKDPLTWYAIITSGVTHFMYSHGSLSVPNEVHMLRLSYKTEAMKELRHTLIQERENVSDRTIFAINTLAVHAGVVIDKGFTQDRIQFSKALGRANSMDYYSTIDHVHEHWNMQVKLMRPRGGPNGISQPNNIRGYPPSPGPGCLTIADIVIAWRNLRCPEFPLPTGTFQVINAQGFDRDATAADMKRRLLSGIPALPKNTMHFRRLNTLLQHIRTLVVDFDQYQRGSAGPGFDLRLLYWTRLMLLHDVLLLPEMTASENPNDLIYELCRLGLTAFMQLVLVPIVASSRLPEKILKQLLPILRKCHAPLHGRILDREHPSLFLWCAALAGMLAMEHYQSLNDSTLLDEVSVLFENVPLKTEKSSWPLAADILRTFIWLDSECDAPGQRYWNYACLFLTELRREGSRPDG